MHAKVCNFLLEPRYVLLLLAGGPAVRDDGLGGGHDVPAQLVARQRRAAAAAHVRPHTQLLVGQKGVEQQEPGADM